MTQTYIGAPIRRREVARFLTGKAKFVDDVKLSHMLYAAILRSLQRGEGQAGQSVQGQAWRVLQALQSMLAST